MPHYRSRKDQKNYATDIKNRTADCPFCALNDASEQIISQTKNFIVIRNIFPYSVWDAHRVTDHLMIVPKMHTEVLSKLCAQAAVEYVGIVSNYELKGYDIYARSPHSTIKSVPHQHTHLIKSDGKRIKALLHLEKPYVRVLI